MTDKTELSVAVRGSEVGGLARAETKHGDTSYRYRQLASADHAVSLTMPVRREDYAWEQGLHPIFEMNLPEGILRHTLTTEFSKTIRGFDDFDLLSIVGPHQLGRVIVGKMPEGAAPKASVHELLVHDGAQGLFEDLLSTYAKYSGVSGVQPKVLVRDDIEVERVTHRGATHIIKAWRAEDYPELAANEYFCMLAADYAGLEVANVALSAGGKFLVVDRFDISSDGSYYLGLEDFTVLNAWRARQKYDGSYEGCAKQIKYLVSPEHMQSSLLQFFKNVAVSAAVQGGDHHLKNSSLIYDHTGSDASIKVSPAYDIITTTAYKTNDQFALLMAGSKAFPKHKILNNFGRVSCELSERAVDAAFQEIADGMSKARVEMTEYIGSHPEFALVGAKMMGAWDAGITKSLLSASRPKVFDMGQGDEATPAKGPRPR